MARISYVLSRGARGLLVALAVAAIGLTAVDSARADVLPGAAAAVAHASALPRLPAGTILSTTVNPSTVSLLPRVRPLPSFLGVSYEYDQFLGAIGGPATGPNFLLERMLYGLARFGGGLPSLRVGGASSDSTFWSPNNEPRPVGIYLRVGLYWMAGAATFAARNHFPLILGLNLLSQDPDIARNLAAATEQGLGSGRVMSYELGNEPELFGKFARAYDAQGNGIFLRPPSYSQTQHDAEFAARAQSIRQRLPGLPLAGPATSLTGWGSTLPYFLSPNHSLVNMATVHFYPFCACSTSYRDPSHPTLYRLLSPLAVPASRIYAAASQARHYGLGLQFTEVGSIAGGGGPLGGTFASALWGADLMLTAAASGVRGLDFHTSGSYAPFFFEYKGRWTAYASPLYYAMLFYARVTANRGRFLPYGTFGAQKAPGVNVTTWSTVDDRGTVRVGILNKDLRRSGWVQIHVPRGFFRASVVRLRAPSSLSTTGVTLAGQRFSTVTSTAGLLGRFLSTPVSRGSGETYRVFMPRTSAAVLTVGRS